MKRLLDILILATVVISVYVFVGPFITVRGLNAGVAERDPEKLSDNIDFPNLRSNLKEQLNATILHGSTAESNSAFGIVGAVGASIIVDSTVEAFVTPSGLATLMSGDQPMFARDISRRVGLSDLSTSKEIGRPADNDSQPLGREGSIARKSPDLFANARYTYDSPSKFSAWIQNKEGEDVRLVLTREGLSWRLSKIILPFPEPSSKKPDISTTIRSDTHGLPLDADASAQFKVSPGRVQGVTAWVVQLRSFSAEARAEELNKKLRGAGFPSFVETLEEGGAKVYRVRVGPELRRLQAQNTRDRLLEMEGLEGIIVPYP